MVGWNDATDSLPVLQTALAGAASGAVTRALLQPLDVLKIRFQLQTEPLQATVGSKYSSMLQASLLIVREEGGRALWAGHVPAQLLSISYGLVQFASFEKLTELCRRTDPKLSREYNHSINFACGAVSASAATIASFPFDTVRTRLIAEEKTKRVYNGILNTFAHISRTEGVRALFKGLFPALAQIAPHAGLQFATYNFLSNSVLNKFALFQRRKTPTQNVEPTMLANLLAGSIAGFVAKLAIYPFDLVKKRLQIQGFQQHRSSFGKQFYCTGFFNCIVTIVKEEGYMGLYKGLSPSIAKAVLASALHFAVYDEFKHFLLNKK